MLRIVFIFLLTSVMTQVVHARRGYRIPADQAKVVTQNSWKKGSETAVLFKGQALEDISKCRSFDVKVDEMLWFNIECNGSVFSQTYLLKNDSDFTVTKRAGHTTITKYNYIVKKPQVSRLKQSTLKIPFVEEIIHLKRGQNGELAFYYESFRVDEFGRIVQNKSIQAHGLLNKKMKISSN